MVYFIAYILCGTAYLAFHIGTNLQFYADEVKNMWMNIKVNRFGTAAFNFYMMLIAMLMLIVGWPVFLIHHVYLKLT